MSVPNRSREEHELESKSNADCLESSIGLYSPNEMIEASQKSSMFTSQFTKSEMDMMRAEKSRTVKLFFLKFKCIVVFTVIFVAFLEFLYICLKEFSNNDLFMNQLLTIATLLSNRSLNSLDSNDTLQLSDVFW